MSNPVLFGDVCKKDSEELQDIAKYFDSLGKKETADFIRSVSMRHEILAGAYATASKKSKHVIQKDIDKWKRENL